MDLRARYWAFLFDNLRRAVDEIYVTCESDQSVVECKVGLLCTSIITTNEHMRYNLWPIERDVHFSFSAIPALWGMSEGLLVRELSQNSLTGKN